MTNSNYVTTKQEQISDPFCIQCRALPVTEIYFGVEGLDTAMSFYLFLMGKRTMHVCTCAWCAVSCSFHLRKS